LRAEEIIGSVKREDVGSMTIPATADHAYTLDMLPQNSAHAEMSDIRNSEGQSKMKLRFKDHFCRLSRD